MDTTTITGAQSPVVTVRVPSSLTHIVEQAQRASDHVASITANARRAATSPIVAEIVANTQRATSHVAEIVDRAARAARRVKSRRQRRREAMAVGMARVSRRTRSNLAGLIRLTSGSAHRLSGWVLDLLHDAIDHLRALDAISGPTTVHLEPHAASPTLSGRTHAPAPQSTGYGTCTLTTGPPSTTARAA